jgi:hypothetical protein
MMGGGPVQSAISQPSILIRVILWIAPEPVDDFETLIFSIYFPSEKLHSEGNPN